MASVTGLVGVNVVLDVKGRQIFREVFDLLSVDGFEEGRFTGTIRSENTIDVTTKKTKDGVVEQKKSTVGE